MKALNKMYRLVRLVKREKMQGNVIKCKYCGQSHERKKELCFAWGKYGNAANGKEKTILLNVANQRRYIMLVRI